MQQGNSQSDKTQTDAIPNKGIVAHYRIIGKLGVGGMGEVHLAEDTRLHRRAALKFLSPHLATDENCKARFKREAQAAAALNHSNIITVYEVNEFEGRPYFAMEYAEGHSLSEIISAEELPLSKIADLAIQICEGLREAHAAGIVHRDLKPANILTDKRGRPKIVDFGLATIKGREKLTVTGTTLGTIAYMSPEQAQGKDLDQRSDLFSFGVVLYEMIAGRAPFTRETETATINAIMNFTPEPLADYRPNTPLELQQIVSKLLEKDPALRYQNASQVIRDLKGLAITVEADTARPASRNRKKRLLLAASVSVVILAAIVLAVKFLLLPAPKLSTPKAPARIKMLAVLPFQNLGSPEDEYFADGITEEILTNLAKLSGLGVTSRTSAMQYKKTEKALPQIGAELGVDYVLEGTIQWDKSVDPPRVRIHPQLIRASDDVHLWAERYDAVMDDVFEVQSSISGQVVKALDIVLLKRERQALEAKPTENLEAYDYYLRGMDYYNRGYNNNLLIALQMLEKAVELDPTFAQAYTRLARTHLSLYWYFYDRTEERLAKAREAVEKAFQLSPDLPEAHCAMGFYYYHGYLDYDRALKHFRIAKEKMKDNSEVFFGIACVLRRQGKLEEAVDNFRKAAKLDPRSPFMVANTAETYYLLGNFQEAERYYGLSISMHPDSADSYGLMAMLYLRWEGQTGKARSFLQKAPAQVLSSDDTWVVPIRILLDVFDGNYEAALEVLSQVTPDALDQQFFFVPKDQLRAQIYGLMNDRERGQSSWQSALALLEPLVEKRPEDERLHSALGIAYAGLGRKDEAIREGKRAVELLPVTKEAWRGMYRVRDLARICVMIGEYDEAIRQLEFIFSLPGGPSVPLLRLDPIWNPLFDHPRFPELLRKYDAFGAGKPRAR